MYLGEAAVSRAGVESLVVAHVIIAIVTLAACACAKMRPYAAALTMYAAIVAWAILSTMLGPERQALGEAEFYWRFARLALTIGRSALDHNAVRTPVPVRPKRPRQCLKSPGLCGSASEVSPPILRFAAKGRGCAPDVRRSPERAFLKKPAERIASR